jgi:hypothetical protein
MVGRRLPSFDPESGEYSTSKRRIQLFKRIYQNYYHWRSLIESGGVSDILAVDGEEIYIGDLMVGIETLPLRQRQAFELICLHGYTESAATAILLPNSRWSTPVQQYSDDGLKKMVAAYDAKQDGTWNPIEARRKRRKRATPPCQDTPETQELKETQKSGYGDSTEREHLNDDDGLKSATPEAEPGSPSV